MSTPPVLLIIFNRPDTIVRVIEAVAQAKPSRVYIAGDGPRKGREGEAKTVKETREAALQAITWPCEVKTRFSEENQGCKNGVANAITWFFENEEAGIILEDDCLPDPSFFPYAAELLEYYKDDERIMSISGNNFQPRRRTPHSYYYSRYPHVWGWASWRRAWKYFDLDLPSKERGEAMERVFDKYTQSNGERNFWRSMLQRIDDGEVCTWDAPWTYSIWSNNGCAILPEVNLVQNIGFDERATHTTDHCAADRYPQRHSTSLPLQHPTEIQLQNDADHYTAEEEFNIPDAPPPPSPEKKNMTKLRKKILQLRLGKNGHLRVLGKEIWRSNKKSSPTSKTPSPKVRQQYEYTIGNFTIELPADHGLAQNQKNHPLYDRFLPFLSKELDPNSTIIDVGANCGDTFAGMASTNHKARYLCIEADKRFFSFLEENAKRMAKVAPELRYDCIQAFVGEKLDNVKMEGIAGTRHAVPSETPDGLRSQTLDSIIGETPAAEISLIKTDTDGFDFDVINSASKILTKGSPLLFYECEYENDQQLENYLQLLDKLTDLGYKNISAFDNFGNWMTTTTEPSQIKNLMHYVARQNDQKATRAIYYMDILAYKDAQIPTAERAIKAFCNSL